ncbi:MAG: hypothetical protein IPL78_02570 [Chloroflexi bacterium]|nr:hypothetical protein [Chloroflexota bacterium]
MTFPRLRPVAIILVTSLVGFILYWPVLKLPLIYDTLLHIRITGELDWGLVWLPTDSFGFYRPLTFAPLLLIKDLFDGYPVWLLQGLNWLQHGVNVGLLSWLALRLWPERPWRSLLAGLFFAVFPFSYQAVAVYGHNVHLTTAGLLLLGLHTYLSANRKEPLPVSSTQSPVSSPHSLPPSSYLARAGRWLPTLAIFALAILSHESAILFGAMAALVAWADGGWPLAVGGMGRNIRQFGAYLWRSPWFGFLALGGMYIVVYQFFPISRAPQAVDGEVGSWLVRGLYLAQAAAYPLAWLAHLLPQNWGVTVVVLAAAATIFLTLFSLRQPESRFALLLGWGWWGLAVAVIAIPLSTNYLLHGPRLLYLSSVGLAIAWAVMVDYVSGFKFRVSSFEFQVSSWGWIRWVVGVGFVGFVLVSNWVFVRGRMADYARLTGGVDVVAQVMAEEPAAVGITLINLPQWLAQPRTTYPVGAELEQMLGDYLFAEELMAHNLGVDHPVLAVVVPELLQPTAYGYQIHNQHPITALTELPVTRRQQFFLTRYWEDGPVMIHLGGLQPANAAATPIASFTVYDLLSAEAQACDEAVEVTLVWRGREEIPPTTSVFVQLLDASGQLMAQADGPPLSLPPNLLPWRGRELVDVRNLPLPEGKTATQLLVGVYDYVTAERLAGVDAALRPLPDNALTVPVIACPE